MNILKIVSYLKSMILVVEAFSNTFSLVKVYLLNNFQYCQIVNLSKSRPKNSNFNKLRETKFRYPFELPYLSFSS